jgi:phage shock protein A
VEGFLMNNALTMMAEKPNEIIGDGITGNEPVFNLDLMRELAANELGKLKSLPECDLATEKGRKALKAAVKPVKEMFADFEKNIKVTKKAFSEIPKKCDAVSKLMRDMSEPEIEKALAPLKELDEQEKLVQRWWKKDGIPHTKYELESGLEALKGTEPSLYSSEGEITGFWTHKTEYVAEWEKCLGRIYAAENAEREEAERLRQQAEEQRRRQAEIDAEHRRLAAESAELERKKAAYEAAHNQAAAVNPANPGSSAKECPEGAPPVLSDADKQGMRREAVVAMRKIIEGAKTGEPWLDVCKAIYAGLVPHVRFVYG